MAKRLVPIVLALTIGAGAAAPTADAYIRGCGYTRGYYVSVNSVTSCPFGLNVARSFAAGQRNPYVYSPVTGRYYRMYCSRRSSRTWVCTGGNNAYVRMRR